MQKVPGLALLAQVGLKIVIRSERLTEIAIQYKQVLFMK